MKKGRLAHNESGGGDVKPLHPAVRLVHFLPVAPPYISVCVIFPARVLRVLKSVFPFNGNCTLSRFFEILLLFCTKNSGGNAANEFKRHEASLRPLYFALDWVEVAGLLPSSRLNICNSSPLKQSNVTRCAPSSSSRPPSMPQIN